MAPSMASAVRYLVDEIRALGVRAAADPAELPDLPGVLVYPSVADFSRFDGTLELALDVILVASGVPSLAALDQLDELVSILGREILTGELRAVTLNLPSLTSGGDPVPALMATVSLQVTEE